jgi:hypothetical protein
MCSGCGWILYWHVQGINACKWKLQWFIFPKENKVCQTWQHNLQNMYNELGREFTQGWQLPHDLYVEEPSFSGLPLNLLNYYTRAESGQEGGRRHGGFFPFPPHIHSDCCNRVQFPDSPLTLGLIQYVFSCSLIILLKVGFFSYRKNLSISLKAFEN